MDALQNMVIATFSGEHPVGPVTILKSASQC